MNFTNFKSTNIKEIYLFVLNGALSTIIHFTILFFLVELNTFEYVSISYFIAAIISIFISFLGNKYFVFQNKNSFVKDILRFFCLYISLLLLNSLLVYVLCDILKINYQIGFIITLIIQTVLSYLGLKILVFLK